MHSLHHMPESSQLISVQTPTKPQTCPECGISYGTRAALLTHLAKCHPEKAAAAPPEPYQKALDSLGGLPQCSHCKKKFSTWQLLQRHVEGNYCSVRHSFLPQPLTAPDKPEQPVQPVPPVFSDTQLQQLLHKYAANAIFHISHKQRYRQHCLVCGQWVASSKVMKLHYQHSHSQLMQQHNHKTPALCASYTGCGSPCLYCHTSVAIPRLHKLACTVLWQFCLSFAAADGGPGSGDKGSLRGSGPEQPSGLRRCTVWDGEPASECGGLPPKLPSWREHRASAKDPQTTEAHLVPTISGAATRAGARATRTRLSFIPWCMLWGDSSFDKKHSSKS